MSFHDWKQQQIERDTKERGVFTFRSRIWYYAAYGRYLQNVSKEDED